MYNDLGLTAYRDAIQRYLDMHYQDVPYLTLQTVRSGYQQDASPASEARWIAELLDLAPITPTTVCDDAAGD